MSDDFDQASWERRWSQALADHGDAVAGRPPNAQLVEVAAGLDPGRALDAGCGHGAEAMWLAARGWEVTAVDFSATALDHARATAERLGDDVAGRIHWVEGDLGVVTPGPQAFDLVHSLYVHVAGPVEEMVARLANGVAPGGTLFMVGHLPVDPETGEPSPAAGQQQVTVEEALNALPEDNWSIDTAEVMRRADGRGADAVVRATYTGGHDG